MLVVVHVLYVVYVVNVLVVVYLVYVVCKVMAVVHVVYVLCGGDGACCGACGCCGGTIFLGRLSQLPDHVSCIQYMHHVVQAYNTPWTTMLRARVHAEEIDYNVHES